MKLAASGKRRAARAGAEKGRVESKIASAAKNMARASFSCSPSFQFRQFHFHARFRAGTTNSIRLFSSLPGGQLFCSGRRFFAPARFGSTNCNQRSEPARRLTRLCSGASPLPLLFGGRHRRSGGLTYTPLLGAAHLRDEQLPLIEPAKMRASRAGWN